jgi:putative pyruvate formate lyase activating enzyme
MLVSSAGPHFGEEAPLVGHRGSGTIFFTNCNLECIFCQNYDISQLGRGHGVTNEELAVMMLRLVQMGCHNINLVTPTHFVPQIVESITIAAHKGLNVPIVYNCGGYESVKTIRLLEGIVDIYMPDIKYGPGENSGIYSGAGDYFERATEAAKEMYRQVGSLETDGSGIAERGMLVRHLVLPGGLAKSKDVLRFIRDELGEDSYVNIMDQYRPSYRASERPELMSRPSQDEITEVKRIARELGLSRGFE